MNLPPQLAAPPPRFALRAEWIVPVEAPPLRNGQIVVERGWITSLVPRQDKVPADCVFDLGHVAILPGLVNAHTHLEFSGLMRPLGWPDMALPDWIREVVAWRRANSVTVSDESTGLDVAVRDGIEESLGLGVTALGEIATRPWPPQPWQDPPLGMVVFRELLGLKQERAFAGEAAMQAHVAAAHETGAAWLAGLSPHAPYSVHPETLRAAVALSSQNRLPLAMHLAESPEELELMRRGGGPFRELLEELGAWEAGVLPTGVRPLDYLHTLAGSHRTLVIHGNYLDDDEIAYCAAQRDKISVVYCPRTHAYFGHSPYPLRKMLAAGVRVALGTDSRASSPDLDLLSDMRFVAARHDLCAEAILRLGTLAAAEALGLEHASGSLAAGKRAAFCVVELPLGSPCNDRGQDIPSILLHENCRTLGGIFVAPQGNAPLRG